jgi:hypothetical protein
LVCHATTQFGERRATEPSRHVQTEASSHLLTRATLQELPSRFPALMLANCRRLLPHSKLRPSSVKLLLFFFLICSSASSLKQPGLQVKKGHGGLDERDVERVNGKWREDSRVTRQRGRTRQKKSAEVSGRPQRRGRNARRPSHRLWASANLSGYDDFRIDCGSAKLEIKGFLLLVVVAGCFFH